MKKIPRKALNGKFYNTRQVGKPRTRSEDVVRRNTSCPRSKRMEETSRRQRRMEASPEGGHNPEDGWMGEWVV